MAPNSPTSDFGGQPQLWPGLSFEFIVDAINEGILVCDLEGKLLYVNARMAEMLGYEREEMVGRTLFSFMSGQWAEQARENLQRRARGVSETFEHEFLTSHNDTIHTLVATRPIRVTQDKYEASLVAITDISERVEAVEQLRLSQARTMELDRLVVAGTLAAGVGHEINNPLAFLSGHLDLAQVTIEECLSLLRESNEADISDDHVEQNRDHVVQALGEVMHNLDAASRGAHRIRDILDDLRMFTRDEKSPPYPIEVTEILESTVRLATHTLSSQTRLVRDYAFVPQAIGHETGLGQVLLNLLINAVQAIEAAEGDEHTLRIALDKRDSWVVVDIEDSGDGIQPEHLDRIFDPFFTTKDPADGTGLGLSISKRLVEQMGGEISVDSEPGKGSCFTLRLQVAGSED
jgi:PAS domain S-box-containing protein